MKLKELGRERFPVKVLPPCRPVIQVQINSQKTHGFKEQMRIGQQIADQLDVIMPLSEAADTLGVSRTYLRRLECRALYKIAMRLRQLDLNSL
jgi:hypothetical protein